MRRTSSELCIILMLVAAVAQLAWATDPPIYAEVQATETAPLHPVWQEGGDLDENPPAPPTALLPALKDLMPYPPSAPPERLPWPEAETGVTYDAVTGETTLLRYDPSTPSPSMSRGGYLGVSPGFCEEDSSKSFGDMTHISTTEDPPWRMNVRLLIRFPDNGGGDDHWSVCSGTMQDSEVVQTAGHCVYSHDVDITDWADEIWVFPGWDGVGDPWNRPTQPYGYAHATYFASFTGWTSSGDHDYDRGFIRLTRGVGMLTGWFGWHWGDSCAWHQAKTYHNASYPAESCPDPGLHTGEDMYYWYGMIDACPDNQFQLNTGGGHCFDTVWGGMSGSGMYYIDGDSRNVHAVCSTSNRFDRGYYCRMTESWVNYLNDTIIPGARGASFDLQGLDVNMAPTTIQAGDQFTLSNALSVNPTNGTADSTWFFDVRLSTNDNISSADTLLSTQSYSWSYGAMSSVRVNMVLPTIPLNTPSGTYWVGVEWDPSTDGDPTNNDTDRWDAQQITVVGVADLRADYISAPSGVYASGETFPVSYQATNIGGEPSNTVTVEVRASVNTTITTYDTLLATFTYPGAPAGSTIYDLRYVSFPPSLDNGYYYIGMIVSSSDDVDGSNNTDYEINPLMKFDGVFYDGFESSDTSRWDYVVP